MNLNPKHLIRILENNGFIYKRSKGSHQLYFNPVSNKTVIVPFHSGRDLKKGTFLTILKQAGIEKENLE
jgi:predicted RNA binding protein YcfA (HicA-like mRNA interferase family)